MSKGEQEPRKKPAIKAGNDQLKKGNGQSRPLSDAELDGISGGAHEMAKKREN